MKVELRPVEPDDLPVFFEDQADPVAPRWPRSRRGTRKAFDAHWARILHGRGNVVLTVELDGEPVGNIRG